MSTITEGNPSSRSQLRKKIIIIITIKYCFLSPRFGFYSLLSSVYIDGTFSPIKNNFGKMQPATTTAATENVKIKNRKAGRCSFITTQAKQ